MLLGSLIKATSGFFKSLTLHWDSPEEATLFAGVPEPGRDVPNSYCSKHWHVGYHTIDVDSPLRRRTARFIVGPFLWLFILR